MQAETWQQVSHRRAFPIHQQAQCQAYRRGSLSWSSYLPDLWLDKWMTPAWFSVSDDICGLTRGFSDRPFIRPSTFGNRFMCVCKCVASHSFRVFSPIWIILKAQYFVVPFECDKMSEILFLIRNKRTNTESPQSQMDSAMVSFPLSSLLKNLFSCPGAVHPCPFPWIPYFLLFHSAVICSSSFPSFYTIPTSGSSLRDYTESLSWTCLLPLVS